MKNKKISSGFAPIIILVLIVLVVVDYFGYKNNWFKPQTLVENSPSPTATVVSTSDWKTYTNTKYGFEFQYPSDWIDLASKPEDVSFFKSIDDQINVVVKKSTSIDQLIQELSITNQESVTFNGMKFTKISYYTKPSGDIVEYVIANKDDLLVFLGNTKILSTFQFTK
jgi:hypothetical protein